MEHLEEAITRLTQSQSSFAQNHTTHSQTQTAFSQTQATMNSKIDSMMEHLAAITSVPNRPPLINTLNPTPIPQPHMKLDVSRFDG